MKLKIIANRELFEDWQYLCEKLKTFGAIIQNNIEISEEDYQEFREKYENTISEIEIYKEKIENYIDPDGEFLVGGHL